MLDAFVTTWKESVFAPANFFRRMPREDHYGAVILYYVVISVVAAGCQLFWQNVLPPLALTEVMRTLRDQQTGFSEVTGFLFSPVVALIVLYIVAGVAQVMLMIVRGQKYGYDTTTRAVAFAHGPAVFTIVPYVGPLIGGIWSIVLAIIGLRETHETTTGKAAAAVLLPLVLLAFLVVILGILIAAFGIMSTRL